MNAHLIATTSGGDLTPLGTGGQRAVDCWDTLTLLLERELSAAHAALLAEPLTNAARGTVDWYARGTGAATRLSTLPPAVRGEINARLEALVGEIEVLATRLKASTAEGDRFLGSMLSLALQIPGSDFVYAMGEHPILVAWGHSTGGARPQGMVLTGLRRVAEARRWSVLPPPSKALLRAAEEQARPARRAWLGPFSAGGIMLALALLFLLLAARSWSSAQSPPCTVPQAELGLIAILQDARGRGAALQIERARLAEELGHQRHQCAPVPARTP